MNQEKAALVDHFASPKVLYGPSCTAASKHAIAALKADRRMRPLRAELRAAGFFEPMRLRFAIRLVMIVSVILTGWAVMVFAHGWAWRLGAVVAVGFMIIQSAFFAHEAAHCAIRLSAWKTELLGQITDTILVGYDFAYFRRSHDLHHFHTNEVDNDPDALSSLFSVNDWSARHKTGFGRVITRWQGVLLPILYSSWAFAMKWDGLTYVFRNRRRLRLDAAMLVVHVVFWLVIPTWLVGVGVALVNYLSWNVVAGWYLGLIIPVNHVGRPAMEPHENVDFATQQVLSARNLIEPPWLPGGGWLYDMFFIGLNHQIEHHLFPFVGAPRLRRGRAAVKAFCRQHGLPYGEWRYLDALAETHVHLWRVGRRAARGRPNGASSQPSSIPTIDRVGPRHMIGPILRYLRDPHATLPHYAQRYGDPFFLPVPGTRGTLVTGRPEGIREIFGAPPDTFEPFASDAHRRVMGARGFFARSGSAQRAARKLVQPAMVGAALRACGPALEAALDRYTRDWRAGDVVDLSALGKTIALDAVSAALFGSRAPRLTDRLRRSFAEGLERTHPAPLYLPFLRHEFGGRGPWARAMIMLRETMALLDEEIRARLASEHGDGITGSLLEARYDDGSAMDPDEIRDLLYDLTIAGYDTSASALAWAIHDVVHTHGVQARLAGELESLGRSPAPDALVGSQYLEAVCNETLRRRPLLVLVSRRLRASFELLGHKLPAGTGVSAAIGIAHFREDVYPEPLTFRPERFLERSFSPFEYLPFGGGAKRCLGASLALYEMKVILGTLFSRFELSAADQRPARPRPQGVSIAPSRPVRMRVRRRDR